jgi:uncharacterized UBP type Zn finger protein
MVPAAIAFEDTNRHQDGQEWVITLIEAIGKELPLGRKEEWGGIFEIGIGGTFKCTAGHIQLKMPDVLSVLQLGIIGKATGHPILTMDQAVQHYFSEELMEKNCSEEGCNAVKATSSSHITFLPKLLILQYNRFRGPGYKIKHPVSGTINYNLNDIQYKLVGLLVHLGEEDDTGHYVSVTR